MHLLSLFEADLPADYPVESFKKRINIDSPHSNITPGTFMNVQPDLPYQFLVIL
jgi:hypothetical protein